MELNKKVIIRADRAGVFYGTIIRKDGDEVELKDYTTEELRAELNLANSLKQKMERIIDVTTQHNLLVNILKERRTEYERN